jgi:IS5 family transposase
MMRQQLPLMQEFIDHEHAQELSAMSEALDACSGVLVRVEADLLQDRDPSLGRCGLTADQVVRALVVKQMNDFSYEVLAFHLADSTCYRRFCRIGVMEKPPSRSTLQENIKRLTPETLEAINRALVRWAQKHSVERADVVRGDCTVVQTTAHPPTDSWLLWDTVRVLVRELKCVREYGVDFHDHTRRAKRRWRAIANAQRREDRVALYRDLLQLTEETLESASRAVWRLAGVGDAEAQASRVIVQNHVTLGRRVVDQTRRRVLEGEVVPSREKVVSIFESHTDIIVKSRREVEYGHKVCLTTGKSSMVLDCVILDGNPADSTLATEMIRRHREIFGTVPLAVALDGGFASKDNLAEAKAMGVGAVAFSKRRGIEIREMVPEAWVYKRLRDFRAGIEGCISYLKRCFGWTRSSWKGFASFKSYVWASIVSANLLILARHRMAASP